jgi:hypothetical protein
MSKYDGLTSFLKKPTLTMSFREIELHIAPEMLPASARTHRPWWGNEQDASSRQCRAWLDAGWEVDSVDLKSERVVFRKV